MKYLQYTPILSSMNPHLSLPHLQQLIQRLLPQMPISSFVYSHHFTDDLTEIPGLAGISDDELEEIKKKYKKISIQALQILKTWRKIHRKDLVKIFNKDLDEILSMYFSMKFCYVLVCLMLQRSKLFYFQNDNSILYIICVRNTSSFTCNFPLNFHVNYSFNCY